MDIVKPDAVSIDLILIQRWLRDVNTSYKGFRSKILLTNIETLKRSQIFGNFSDHPHIFNQWYFPTNPEMENLIKM